MNTPIDPFTPRNGTVSVPLRKAFYHTARWRRLRRAQLSRQPVCQRCDSQLATDVDHIDGNNQNNDLSNLQSLCKSCHSKKTYHEDTRR